MGSKTVIIGAGAAGMACAGFALRRGAEVTLLDKNARPGRKLQITGKGRCNVTNNCSPEELIRHVHTNPRFLYSAFHAFSAQDTMELFESLGVPLKTERGNRVFPVSDQAVDIVKALKRFCGDAQFLQKARATEVLQQDGAVCGVRLEGGECLPADAVVIATGGMSYPLTGSDGDGYRLAGQLGHTVVPVRASLVPVITRENWCAELMGLSLRNVTLTLKNAKGKTVFSELGEMLFTHFGVSGPLVLSASAYMDGNPSDYRMEIDLKPGLEEQQLDTRLLRDFEEARNRDFSNALDHLLPRKLIPVAVRLSGIPADTKVHSVTKEQRRSFVRLLKALPVTPAGFRPVDEAIITAGGISVREINPKTMESKRVRGLFFAGEVIDVDGFTGGFNLQIAYATAYLAAQSL